jgi:hypothetical protein
MRHRRDIPDLQHPARSGAGRRPRPRLGALGHGGGDVLVGVGGAGERWRSRAAVVSGPASQRSATSVLWVRAAAAAAWARCAARLDDPEPVVPAPSPLLVDLRDRLTAARSPAGVPARSR